MSDRYVKIHTTQPCWFAELNPNELCLLLHMANLTEYNASFGVMTAYINPQRKEQISELMGFKNYDSVSNLIVNLVKSNVVYRIARNTYIMNPNLLSCNGNRGVEKAKQYFPSIDEWLEQHN